MIDHFIIKTRRGSNGFTLIELLVAIVVTGMLLIIVMGFTVNTLADGAVSTARSQLLQQAQIAMDAMTADVRLSASAELHNRFQDQYAPSAPADLFSWNSGASSVVLATAVRSKTGNDVIFEDSLHYISYKNNNIYYLKSGTIYKRTLAAPVANNRATTTCPAANASTSCPAERALINNVTGFSIKYYDGAGQLATAPDNARAVEMRIQLSQKKYNRTIKADYTTRTVFRNE